MKFVALVGMIVSGCVALLSIYMLARNEWVFKNRIRALRSDMALYDSLPSYDSMMYDYFWVWDFSYFKKVGHK